MRLEDIRDLLQKKGRRFPHDAAMLAHVIHHGEVCVQDTPNEVLKAAASMKIEHRAPSSTDDRVLWGIKHPFKPYWYVFIEDAHLSGFPMTHDYISQGTELPPEFAE